MSQAGEGMRRPPESSRGERPSTERPSTLSELQGMTARTGYSPLSSQGRQITGALGLLEGHYGPGAVRRAASQAMAPIVAARQNYLPIQDMAQEEGFSDGGSFVGGWIEDQIGANKDDGGKDRLFNRDAETSSGSNPPHGTAPSWYDYKSGWAMAEAQGTPGYGQARMYAGLHHAFRDPQYGGNTRGNELFRAASDTREGVSPGQGALTPPVAQQVHREFSQWVNERQDELGIPDSHLPQRWLRERDA